MIEGRTYRLRDPRQVADEVESVVAGGDLPMVEFVDSTFNEPPGHAEEICAEIVRRGLRVRLRTMGINPGIDRDDDLLIPRYYISPAIGLTGLAEALERAVAIRPNCVRAAESTPDPAMIEAAIKWRADNGINEPMFRTLLRLRAQRMNGDLPAD